MLDDPEDMLGACLKKIAFLLMPPMQPNLSAPSRSDCPETAGAAYLNAEVRDQLVSGDVLAPNSGPRRHKQAVDASTQLAFAYPQGRVPSLLRLRR